jgi:hypothetical protein
MGGWVRRQGSGTFHHSEDSEVGAKDGLSVFNIEGAQKAMESLLFLYLLDLLLSPPASTLSCDTPRRYAVILIPPAIPDKMPHFPPEAPSMQGGRVDESKV